MGHALTYADAVHRVIVAEYAPLKHAAKLLARDANATPRTAENWLAGTNAPSGENLINLMRRCAALRHEINRLVGEPECSSGSNTRLTRSGAAR